MKRSGSTRKYKDIAGLLCIHFYFRLCPCILFKLSNIISCCTSSSKRRQLSLQFTFLGRSFGEVFWRFLNCCSIGFRTFFRTIFPGKIPLTPCLKEPNPLIHPSKGLYAQKLRLVNLILVNFFVFWSQLGTTEVLMGATMWKFFLQTSRTFLNQNV